MLYRFATLEKSESFDMFVTQWHHLFKWDSTADIFLVIFIFFFFLDKLFEKTAPNHWLERVFICIEFQIIIVFVAYRKCGTQDP